MLCVVSRGYRGIPGSHWGILVGSTGHFSRSDGRLIVFLEGKIRGFSELFIGVP